MSERTTWDIQDEFMKDKVWDTGQAPVPQASPEFPDAKPITYPVLTRKQRITLAEDIYEGRVYTDRHCRPEDITSVFMVFALMTAEQKEPVRLNPPGLVYEYVDQASPRTVNGRPCFFSTRMLSREEAKKVMAIYQMLVDRRGDPTEPREKV